jgi:hypothetical protein
VCLVLPSREKSSGRKYASKVFVVEVVGEKEK